MRAASLNVDSFTFLLVILPVSTVLELRTLKNTVSILLPLAHYTEEVAVVAHFHQAWPTEQVVRELTDVVKAFRYDQLTKAVLDAIFPFAFVFVSLVINDREVDPKALVDVVGPPACVALFQIWQGK